MRQFPKRALVLIALAAPLGACNSFLGINFAGHSPRATLPQTAHPAAANAESATSVGRRQLAAGQTGLAIESFQRAMAAGEPIAPAINGMGVAYARLDRFDLAKRYFEQATASDPANPQYTENLARLMRSPALAMRRDGDIARAAVTAAAVPAETAKTVTVGKLQRVSRGEVRIASAPAQSAPTSIRSAANGHVPVDPRFKPLVRFSIAEPDAPQPGAPLRILLPEPKPADAATVASAAKITAGARR